MSRTFCSVSGIPFPRQHASAISSAAAVNGASIDSGISDTPPASLMSCTTP